MKPATKRVARVREGVFAIRLKVIVCKSLERGFGTDLQELSAHARNVGVTPGLDGDSRCLTGARRPSPLRRVERSRTFA